MTASACALDSFMLFWPELFMRRGAAEDPGVDVAGVVHPLTPPLAGHTVAASVAGSATS